MKKVLLAGTALLGLALTSAPAAAELNLDLGGHFRGYGVYADNDAVNAREFGLVRDTEIHFTGEATSDNGLTVGVHYETVLGSTNVETDEAYAYFAGNWGRFNLGKEDGAAYLLQVAAPSADSNIDGLRTQIQGVNTLGARVLDYDHADGRGAQRITYLTPKFSGFQAGLSYAADNDDLATGGATSFTGLGTDTAGELENLMEAGVRWDGEFEGFGMSAGAGYSTAEVQLPTATFAGDVDTWNVGLNVAFSGFSVGGAYLNSEIDSTGANPEDTDTWVVGAAWDNGPYHVGASYLDSSVDNANGTSADADRWAVGAGYTYGPGMSFRGTVAMGDVELATGDEDFTQVTVGTDIQF
ncbi:MAG: porin [Acinetobacter sp.]|nr:porin [Acinetobacter sp.]